ncbi:MAG: hypothetical protein V3V99_04330 [candidate division Zixibacteria bacterium]
MARGNPDKWPSIEISTACPKGRWMMKSILNIKAQSKTASLFLALVILMGAYCNAQNDPYEIIEEKSRSKAIQLSFLGTVLPIAAGIPFLGHGKEVGAANNVAGLSIMGLGLFIGPSLGHFYAENNSRAIGGIGIRVFSAGLAVYGLSTIDIFGDDNSGGGGLFLLGGIACLGSTVADIAKAGKSVDSYNKSHASHNLSIHPTYFANANTPGLNVTLTF